MNTPDATVDYDSPYLIELTDYLADQILGPTGDLEALAAVIAAHPPMLRQVLGQALAAHEHRRQLETDEQSEPQF